MLLDKRVRRIPLRICVTGTRGKSSVTRLISAALREAGFKVLAKTTGSKPAIIFPDGEEREIRRSGPPSILEQKRILSIGAKRRVEVLVAELMSLQPECSFIESLQIIKPNILVITNIRLDHVSQMGSTLEGIASSLAVSIPPKCTIFIPEEEFFPVFQEAGERVNSPLIRVSRDSYQEFIPSVKRVFPYEFEENVRLALAVGEFCGVEKEQVLQGIKEARPDFGSLKAWKAEIGSPPRFFHLISAFAANDPLSTQKILAKIKATVSFRERRLVGILNLRNDRGDRTLQWQQAINSGALRLFHRLLLIGGHARALRRKLKSWDGTEISVIKEKSPRKIMAELSAIEREEVVLVGMGNMGGAGERLVNYWEKIGRPYDT